MNNKYNKIIIDAAIVIVSVVTLFAGYRYFSFRNIDWKPYSSQTYGYSVDLPDSPSEIIKDKPGEAILSLQKFSDGSYFGANQLVFFVQVLIDKPSDNNQKDFSIDHIQEAVSELITWVDGVAGAVTATADAKVIYEKQLPFDPGFPGVNLPGKEIKFQNNANEKVVRLLGKDNYVYILTVSSELGKFDQEAATRFFESFKVSYVKKNTNKSG
jgi:hypothetical protein